MVDRLSNAAIAIFAGWTLLANAAVFSGTGLRELAWSSVALGAAALAFRSWWIGRRTQTAAERPAVSTAAATAKHWRPTLQARGAALCAAAACVAGFAWTGEVVVYWAGALGLSVALALYEFRSIPTRERVAASPAARRCLLVLCLVCASFPLMAHRPDADDAFYVNLAVAAVDHPDAPLIAHDTLHGLAGVEHPLPTYKVHSIELLEAAVAFLTPLRVLDVAHLLVPVFAALLVPLAYARLFRLLTPQRWLWATLTAVAVLACVGEPHQGYGNFSFVRLHQGKAILLTLALPLVMATGVEYSLAPSAARWLRLAAVQIAAVGTSATGLWAAPVVAVLALASGASPRRSSLAPLALGVCASGYVLMLGLALQQQTTGAFALAPTEWLEQADARYALSQVLGHGAVAHAALFCLAGSWALARGALLRRFSLVFALGFLVVLWNPYLASFLGAHLTGPPTYWRVFWALPIPLLLAAALSSPLELERLGRLRFVAAAAVAAGFLFFAPSVRSWSEVNRVRFAAPGWKLPPVGGQAARAMVRAAPSGGVVLAPTEVARWIPTLHHHPTPLVVRELYLEVVRDRLGDLEIDRRLKLARLVAGAEQGDAAAAELLAAAVSDYPLAAVCLAGTALRNPLLRTVLARSELELFAREPGFEIWARPR